MRGVQYLRGALGVIVFTVACGGGGGDYPTSTTPTNNYPPTTPPTTTTTTPAANEVIATDGNAFNPATLNVSKGTTVTFTFQAVTHNVTFANTTGAPANIGNTSNSQVQRVFTTAGTFGYDCTLHPGMHGQVVVQ